MLSITVTGKISSVQFHDGETDAICCSFYLIETYFIDKARFQRVWGVTCPKWMIKSAKALVVANKYIGVTALQARGSTYTADGKQYPCIDIEAASLFIL